jgi:hypothetical protein
VLFWHLGGSIGAVRYAFRDERMDLRFLMIGAILADLVDTPIGLLAWSTFGSVRLFAHSLIFPAAAMVVVLVLTRRGRPRKRWMPLAVGVLMGLVLDGMWRQPETLWWPFLGWEFTTTGFDTAGEYLRWLLTDWRTWALEALGLAYLVFLAGRARLGDPKRRRELVTTGRIRVPIGR